MDGERDPFEVLHGPFDARVHAETFTNYLEVVIAPDGTVEYAVPSHQEKLKEACRAAGVDPVAECPPEYYFDYRTWLLRETGYVAVWRDRYEGQPNARQRQSLVMLADAGLLDLGRR